MYAGSTPSIVTRKDVISLRGPTCLAKVKRKEDEPYPSVHSGPQSLLKQHRQRAGMMLC